MYSVSSNSLLRMSANGLIVVDDPSDYDAFHQEHTASNARFIADGAQVLAQDNVTRNLSNSEQPSGKTALPNRWAASMYE